MKKEYIAVGIIVALGLGLITYSFLGKRNQSLTQSKNLPKQEGFDGKLHFKIEELPQGVIAKSGQFEVKRNEVEGTAAMRGLLNKRDDLLFTLLYKQHISYAEKLPKTLDLSIEKLSRNASSILNQYGVPLRPEVQINFSAFKASKGFARINGEFIKVSDLDLNNFIWADYETDIFRYQLSEIDKRIKRQVLSSEAKKLKITVQAYKEEYVFKKIPMEISEKDINDYLKRYSIEDNPRNRNNAESSLLTQRKKRAVDYILERFVMDLPILVDLKSPVYRLEAKEDWTPSYGNPKAALKITFFGDTKGRLTKQLMTRLMPVLEKYKGIQLLYRPVFNKNDRMQSLVTEMHFCIWMKYPEKFWDYYLESLGDHRNGTEDKLYRVGNNLNLDVDALKQCLVSKQYREVVDYHLQYAAYLGISTAPVVYVGGEVLNGVIQPEEVEEVIQRQLEVPAAGVW